MILGKGFPSARIQQSAGTTRHRHRTPGQNGRCPPCARGQRGNEGRRQRASHVGKGVDQARHRRYLARFDESRRQIAGQGGVCRVDASHRQNDHAQREGGVQGVEQPEKQRRARADGHQKSDLAHLVAQDLQMQYGGKAHAHGSAAPDSLSARPESPRPAC